MIAAIDVGSNALRMAIASIQEDHQPSVLENAREPVRLGQDVFTKGAIPEETGRRAIEAFERFRRLMDKHGVQRWRAVATSAMREARNRDEIVDRIFQTSGIKIMVIGGEEEARLIYLAVANRISLKNKLALLVDIGGGSVEITVVANGRIAATESFRMGAVRLLKELEDSKMGDRAFNQLVREYVDATRRRVKKEIGDKKIDFFVATGGNVESLGDLKQHYFHKEKEKENNILTAPELEELIKDMQAMTFDERVRNLDLRPDRADVIVPAAIVLQKIMKQARVDEVQIPHVGLKEGLLLDLIEESHHKKNGDLRDQMLDSALQLGRKYTFDEQHGTTVARFAAQLFDDTRMLHNLDNKYRLLMEVAALLHDIGHCVTITSHHKHSCYLLLNSPLIGLTESQRAIVANVARYYRKSAPNPGHEPYCNLPVKEQVVVTKLAALLRIADALDKEHDGKLKSFEVEYREPQVILRLKGEGDLLLERWAIAKKSELFEEEFCVKMKIAD